MAVGTLLVFIVVLVAYLGERPDLEVWHTTDDVAGWPSQEASALALA